MPPIPVDTSDLLSPSKLKPPSKPQLAFPSELIDSGSSFGYGKESATSGVESVNGKRRRTSLRLNEKETVQPAKPVVKTVPSKGKPVNASTNLVATSSLKIGQRGPLTTVAANNVKSAPVPTSQPNKRKRPAWDTKGRLEDAEEEAKYLNEALKTANEKVDVLTAQCSEKESSMNELRKAKEELEALLDATKNAAVNVDSEVKRLTDELAVLAASKENQIRDVKMQYEATIRQLGQEKEELENVLNKTKVLLEDCKKELASLQSLSSTQSMTMTELQTENLGLKSKIQVLEGLSGDQGTMIASLKKELADREAEIKALEDKVHEGDRTRKRLHNEIQELKGNIRVFCRMRPPLPSEEGATMNTEDSSFAFRHDQLSGIEEITLRQVTDPPSGSLKPLIKSFPFTFDRVFDPSASQSVVFEEISQLVQSALDGYRVCIFAYGQTGSGKTYTMEGPSDANGKIMIDDEERMGMIPRAVKQIFEAAESLKLKGWTFAMEASFLEIYNETLRDLLVSQSASLEIRHIPNSTKTVVTDLTCLPVTDMAQVFSLLRKSNQHRAVGETQCNERSSRSHSVFTLKLVGENALTGEKSEGLLNLIDLAGSERLSSSGATGDRLKETQAINKSLSCLGDVIMALANKDQHIPYRNSKLTYLLQNSLGGNSKTLMFVNISPVKESLQESLCSLRFAAKVNACQIGTARKNVVK